MTIKDSKYVKVNNVNPLYLILNKLKGCFEDINGRKYLALLLLMKTKKKLGNMKDCGLKSEI